MEKEYIESVKNEKFIQSIGLLKAYLENNIPDEMNKEVFRKTVEKFIARLKDQEHNLIEDYAEFLRQSDVLENYSEDPNYNEDLALVKDIQYFIGSTERLIATLTAYINMANEEIPEIITESNYILMGKNAEIISHTYKEEEKKEEEPIYVNPNPREQSNAEIFNELFPEKNG